MPFVLAGHYTEIRLALLALVSLFFAVNHDPIINTARSTVQQVGGRIGLKFLDGRFNITDAPEQVLKDLDPSTPPELVEWFRTLWRTLVNAAKDGDISLLAFGVSAAATIIAFGILLVTVRRMKLAEKASAERGRQIALGSSTLDPPPLTVEDPNETVTVNVSDPKFEHEDSASKDGEVADLSSSSLAEALGTDEKLPNGSRSDVEGAPSYAAVAAST